MAIAVTGCRRELPSTFPLETAENSGNMIHANAPFEMFDGCFFRYADHWRITGAKSWHEFVNKNCSHLIVTLTNTFRLNSDDGSRFRRFHESLQKIDKPIVVFGMGVQSWDDDLANATLPAEGVELMKFLGERCEAVGVRGEMTQRAFRHFAGVENTFVTGCPSMFSRPQQLVELARNLDASAPGQPAFCGTRLHEPDEKQMLHRAIRAGAFLVEPVSKFNHRFYVDVTQNKTDPEVPYFLRDYVSSTSNGNAVDELRSYFASRYRLFRQLGPWYDFNSESVAFTYGTRFHVNMASVLSGKPALWVTHDSRTRELTEFLHLPSIDLADAVEMDPSDVRARLDYDDFFSHIGGLFDTFNEYLAINGLPEIERIAV